MSSTQSLNIPGTTVPNDGAQHVVATVSFAAIVPVNVIAGQALGAGTLNADASPSTYPVPGTLLVNALDQFGNGIQNTVTYTGVSGDSFTGCQGGTGTTVAAPAYPCMTGAVTLNRTGSGNHPWLNTLTSATLLTVLIQSSADGGVTWQDEASATTVGGIISDRNGQVNTLALQVGPINPRANACQMVCTVTGPSAVEVSGSASVTTR